MGKLATRILISLVCLQVMIVAEFVIGQPSKIDSPFGVDAGEATQAVVPKASAVPSAWDSVSTHKNFMQRVFGIEASDESAEWKASELNTAGSVMETLPASFRSCTTGIRRVKSGRNSEVAGYVYMNEKPIVHITNSGASYKVFAGYLVHEMTHCFQMSNKAVMEKWEDKFWSSSLFWSDPKTPSVSEYGNSSAAEDMAESVRKYWEDGPSMKRYYPDRYEFIKTHIMNNVEYETPNRK